MNLDKKYGTDSSNNLSEKSNAGKRPSRWAIFGLIILAAALTALYVRNVRVVDDALQNQRKLQVELERLENRNELLQKRLNELRSPENVIPKAEEKLQMQTPEEKPEIVE